MFAGWFTRRSSRETASSWQDCLNGGSCRRRIVADSNPIADYWQSGGIGYLVSQLSGHLGHYFTLGCVQLVQIVVGDGYPGRPKPLFFIGTEGSGKSFVPTQYRQVLSNSAASGQCSHLVRADMMPLPTTGFRAEQQIRIVGEEGCRISVRVQNALLLEATIAE